MKLPVVFGLVLSLIAPTPVLAQSPAGPIVTSLARQTAQLARQPQAADAPTPRTEGAVLELRWNELAPLILGHRVVVSMADGMRVTGDVAAVRDDALVLDVVRTTGAPRPGGAYQRDAIRMIVLEREGRTGGRTLGTVFGVLSGVVVGGWVTGTAADSASTGVPLFLGIASGLTAVGYYTGRRLDRRTTVIRVLQ